MPTATADSPAKTSDSATDLLTEARDRYKLASQADDKQRQREYDDLRFQVPELQWPNDVRATRGATTLGNIAVPARPMLSVPKLDQPIQLVLNAERAANLGVTVKPLTSDASDETAEVLQGLYRRIEVDSRANLARSWGYARAAKCGTGAYRILAVYDPDGEHPSDQKLVIKRLFNQECVRWDPYAQEPDFADAEYAFVEDWVPLDRYKRLYPKSDIGSVNHSAFTDLIKEFPDWMRDDPNGKAVLVVEYFRKDYEDATLTVFADGGRGYVEDHPDRPRATGESAYERSESRARIKWSKLNATEELETQTLPIKYIPLVRVVGRELIPFDGERRVTGIIGPNKDAQRLFNYAASNAVELAALEPKAPFVLDPQQIEGYEALWQEANTRNLPYLPINLRVQGQVMGPPQRMQVDAARLGPSMALMAQAGDFIHSGTGAFEPTLGQDSSRARTGRAVLALQQQHDQGSSDFLDNLAEVSMTYEAKVILDWIPHIYDRPGRVERTLDLEDRTKTVMLNQPYTVGQNGRPQALPNGQPPAGTNPQDVKHFDLKKGRYAVAVSIGKAYKTRLDEGNDMLAQLFQAEPQLFQILGDIWLEFQSWPGHHQAAERVKKMLPPPLQEPKPGDSANAAKENAALKGQLQQMQQTMQEMGKAIEQKQVESAGRMAVAKIQASAELQRAQMDNATKIALARIGAGKAKYQADLEAQEERIALGVELAADAMKDDKARAHDVAQASLTHAQALAEAQQAHDLEVAQAEQGAALDFMQGEREQGQELELGDQAHQQALEQGDQQQQQAMQQMAAQQTGPPGEPEGGV